MTTPGPVIEPENLPPQIVSTREEPFSLDFDLHRPLQEITDELTERIERAYLQRVLERYRGRIDRCAAHCGLSRRSISEKLRRYRIDKADFKPNTAPPQGSRPGRVGLISGPDENLAGPRPGGMCDSIGADCVSVMSLGSSLIPRAMPPSRAARFRSSVIVDPIAPWCALFFRRSRRGPSLPIFRPSGQGFVRNSLESGRPPG